MTDERTFINDDFTPGTRRGKWSGVSKEGQRVKKEGRVRTDDRQVIL